MSSLILGLVTVIVIIVMVISFIKALGMYMKVDKIENFESEISEEMQENHKKATKYMMIAVGLVPIFIILCIIIFTNMFLLN